MMTTQPNAILPFRSDGGYASHTRLPTPSDGERWFCRWVVWQRCIYSCYAKVVIDIFVNLNEWRNQRFVFQTNRGPSTATWYCCHTFLFIYVNLITGLLEEMKCYVFDDNEVVVAVDVVAEVESTGLCDDGGNEIRDNTIVKDVSAFAFSWSSWRATMRFIHIYFRFLYILKHAFLSSTIVDY